MLISHSGTGVTVFWGDTWRCGNSGWKGDKINGSSCAFTKGIWDPCEIIWCLHRELKQYVIVFLSSALVQVHQGPELSWYLSGERKIADELCLFIRNIPVIIGVWFDKWLIGQLYFEGPNVGAGRDVLAWSSLFLSHSKINA